MSLRILSIICSKQETAVKAMRQPGSCISPEKSQSPGVKLPNGVYQVVVASVVVKKHGELVNIGYKWHGAGMRTSSINGNVNLLFPMGKSQKLL